MEKVLTYARGGCSLEGKTPQKLGEEVATYERQGFQAVKTTAGPLTPAQQEGEACAAREVIRPPLFQV